MTNLRTLYTFSIWLFVIGALLASAFNNKAHKWFYGRMGWKSKLSKWRKDNPGKLVWFHCASLGEFEQGRPVIEEFRKQHPDFNILLTFFSPSGYEIRKNFSGVDLVAYLPADTPGNAESFLNIIKPAVVVFVKYEYWANYFFSIKHRHIPLFMISAILRPEQRFFGAFKKFWHRVLSCVTQYYVQDEKTEQLLRSSGFHQVTIAGDTRFDRVISIAALSQRNEKIEKFCSGRFIVVGGSTWETEEYMLQSWQRKMQDESVATIIVPHEVDDVHLKAIAEKFPKAIFWSQYKDKELDRADVLVIDVIGMLSFIYRYADVAVIGGGFGKGIHNTLEAAVWNVPVLFGPNYEKFSEAKDLIANGGAISFNDEAGFMEVLEKWRSDSAEKRRCGISAGNYVKSGKGATAVIMSGIAAKI